jgi:hypothetical protein
MILLASRLFGLYPLPHTQTQKSQGVNTLKIDSMLLLKFADIFWFKSKPDSSNAHFTWKPVSFYARIYS